MSIRNKHGLRYKKNEDGTYMVYETFKTLIEQGKDLVTASLTVEDLKAVNKIKTKNLTTQYFKDFPDTQCLIWHDEEIEELKWSAFKKSLQGV